MSHRHSLLAAAVLLAGCAAGEGAPVTPAGPEPPAQEANPPASTPEDAPPTPESTPPIGAARQLVIEGSYDRLVFPGETAELAVLYLDADDQTVPGARLQARFVNALGEDLDPALLGESFLRTTQASTDDDGRGVFELAAGPTEASFSIEVAADGAAPVYWTIHVAPNGAGRLRVMVNPADGLSFAEAQVAIYEHPACAQLANAPGSAGPIYQEMPAVGPDGGASVSGELAAGAWLSVAVRARAASGAVIAFGCVDGVEIVGGREAVVDVPLAALPFRVKGRYAVEHHLDLSDRIAGADDALLQQIATIAGGIEGGRGNAIVTLVCDSGRVNGAVCTGLRLFGPGVIDDVIERSVDSRVLDALETFGDLYSLMRDLHLMGEIEIVADQPDAQGRLLANQDRISGLKLIWRSGCPFDAVEDCIRELRLEALGLPGGLTAGFDGAVDDRGTLAIARHQIALPLGRIARGVAEQWLLPAVLGRPGPVTLDALVAELLPCAEIAAAAPAGALTEGLCEEVLPGVVTDLIAGELDAFSVDADGFALEGHVSLIDDDGDLRVDRLANGVWDGEVTGTFEGCRTDACD